MNYDLAGRELAAQLIGLAGQQQRVWDALGRNTQIITKAWSQQIPPDGYDGVGNLRCIHKKDIFGAITENYHYDDLYQLIGEDGPLTHTYAYDSLQNRLQKDMQPYAVNGLNQITSDSMTSYAYDLNGNRIRKDAPQASTQYVYDALNRLIVAEQPNAWQVRYSYDAFGRRLTRTLCTWNGEWNESETVSYLYQGQKEIGMLREGHIDQLRVLGHGRGAELGAAIALELRGQIYAPIHDHRGNVCCLIDSTTGNVVEGYCYTAFGEIRSL